MAESYDFGQRTINLMNFYLKSENTEEEFKRIIEKCQNSNTKYTDPNFYPQIEIKKEDETILGSHQWLRAEDYYSNLYENVKSDTICQGQIGDCYLITAMIYLAQNPDLIKDVIHPKSSLKYGCILIYFYFLGHRIPVIVETQIPFNTNAMRPIFSKPRSNEDSCWFIFIEKAFAKACGDYVSIDSGTADFAVRILTDQYTENHNRFGCNNKLFNPIDQLFDKLYILSNKKAMLIASININEIPNFSFSSKNFEQKTGLINEHGYQILDVKKVENKKFIKLRNPWGNFEWKGSYSNGSKELTEKLKKELNHTNENNGSFWMIDNDFIKYFTNIIISLPKEKNWKSMNVYGKIEGYLDKRAPMGKKSNTGCLPQWSIKFTKKKRC